MESNTSQHSKHSHSSTNKIAHSHKSAPPTAASVMPINNSASAPSTNSALGNSGNTSGGVGLGMGMGMGVGMGVGMGMVATGIPIAQLHGGHSGNGGMGMGMGGGMGMNMNMNGMNGLNGLNAVPVEGMLSSPLPPLHAHIASQHLPQHGVVQHAVPVSASLPVTVPHTPPPAAATPLGTTPSSATIATAATTNQHPMPRMNPQSVDSDEDEEEDDDSSSESHTNPNASSGPSFINESDSIKDEKDHKEKKGGRRKISIEFIENKSRRHVTFSKRKAGLIKKVCCGCK